MNSTEIIQRLPFEFAARLAADDYFSDISIVVAEEGNVALELAKKQAVLTEKAGKRGAAVIVLPIVGDDLQPSIGFGPMTLYPAFQTVENLELNRGQGGTGKSARQLARRVRDVIKVGGMTGLIIDLRTDKPCIEPVNFEEKIGKLAKGCQVNFTCLEAPASTPSQVMTPSFTPVGQAQFSLACATDGASIYFTVDDSYPSPQNNTARLYDGNLVDILNSGFIVRACAYQAGMIASWVTRWELQPLS